MVPAVRLAGAAAALREQIGVPVEEWQRATYDYGLELVRSARGTGDIPGSLGRGVRLVATGRDRRGAAGQPPAASPSEMSETPAVGTMAGLTPRESDVLRLWLRA